ncbi:MAG: hypothetical protein LBE89_04880 [Helicobacteraceae bacterium]|nr:hypothetical protein [Helicobacteraceae bacterium]
MFQLSLNLSNGGREGRRNSSLSYRALTRAFDANSSRLYNRLSYRKVFNAFSKPFAAVTLLAFLFVGCGGSNDDETRGNCKAGFDCKVSFYDANLDFNGSISVPINSVINIAQLKNDLDLNATALYLASSTTDRIDETSYKVNKNVNFYAIPKVYEIWTETNLNAAHDHLDQNRSYIMFNNINLTGATLDASAGWKPIGSYYLTGTGINPFTAIFNGNGYKITNLWINRPTNPVGLFSHINNAKIRNLGVEINSGKGGVRGGDRVGGIAGQVENNSSITNCYSTGDVGETSSYSYSVGGIAGYVDNNSSITDSYSTGNVSGKYEHVGGIAGYVNNNSSITNSYSTGDVSARGEVGGIAGNVYNNSSITNSYSTGDVSATSTGDIGGIAGDVGYSSTITNSYSTANVSGTSASYVGGIAGNVHRSSTIANSYSTGNVSVSGTSNGHVGGIAGATRYSSSITNSYSTGNVSGTSYVGGIAGDIDSSTIKNNATINQKISGSSTVNRIVGYIYSGTSENNFALNDILGSFSKASVLANNGTSKSIAELKLQSTYKSGLGWKFGNDKDNPWVWEAFGGYSYPTLYWQTVAP